MATKFLIAISARDWIRTNPGYQLFIDDVCRNCVVKSERASVRASSTYFFSVSTCQNKYKILSRKPNTVY